LTRFPPERPGHDARAVASIRASDLLTRAVRLHGISLGRPVDVLLDRDELRIVGLDILCGDRVHRFLPFATATFAGGTIAIRSPLVLSEEDELAFYRARTLSLATLRGQAVVRDGRTEGTLDDVVIGPGGILEALVVAGERGERRRMRFDERVRFEPGSRSAA
jgi:hypothetical protein